MTAASTPRSPAASRPGTPRWAARPTAAPTPASWPTSPLARAPSTSTATRSSCSVASRASSSPRRAAARALRRRSSSRSTTCSTRSRRASPRRARPSASSCSPRPTPRSRTDPAKRPSGGMAAEDEEEVVPVLRVEDAGRAIAWYARLGFVKEWGHQFEPGLPSFVSVARGAVRLYLSEHTGDARPNTLIHLYVKDVDVVAEEFGVSVDEDGLAGRECALTDPDGNRLRVASRRS